MKLKRLEIQGFKSFPDKTVFKFQEDGLTAVVGPNGCGKSNIVDAVRWTLGEQSAKLLRGQMMEDVIFSGSEKRKPSGMAEVTLLFDSDGNLPDPWRDYAEISISRKLFRTGESEYAINGVACRLKDVRELLADAGGSSRGYSIVEQGRISLLINSKPEEKRALIEEAAGVLKYRMRRLEAERKLERTRQNLLRVGDIIREVKRQLDALKRSAAKARRYHRLRDELEALVLRQRFEEFSALGSESRVLEGTLGDQRARLEDLSSSLAALEAREAELRIQLADGEDEISCSFDELRKVENEVARLEGDISVRKGAIASLEERLARLAEDERDILLRTESDLNQKAQLELELAAIVDDHEKLAVGLDEARSEYARSEEELETARQDLEEIRSRLFSLGTERNRLEMDIESSRRTLEGTARRAREAAERMSVLSERIARAEDELAAGERGLKDAAEASRALARDIGAGREALARSREEVEELEREIAAVSEKLAELRGLQRTLASLEEDLEGFSDGVRNVIKEYGTGRASGIVGVVADHLQVPQPYERAVMAVLGERLGHVIVDEPDSARSAIDFLKQRSRGRGGFIPIRPRANGNGHGGPTVADLRSVRAEGVVGPLADLVTFSSELNGIGDFLLGDTLLVKDLKGAVDLWKRNGFTATMVTLDGDVIESTGIITGGNMESGEESVLARKRKLREVTEAAGEVQEEVRRLRERRDGARERIAVTEMEILDLERRQREADKILLDAETARAVLLREKEHLDAGRLDVQAEDEMIRRESSELEGRIRSADSRLAEIRSGEALAAERLVEVENAFQRHGIALEKSRLELEDARLKVNTADLKRENSRKALQNAVDRSREAEERRQRITAEQTDSQRRIALHREEIEASEQVVRDKAGEMEARRASLAELRNAQETARAEVEEVAVKARDLRNQSTALRDEMASLDIRIHEFRSEMQHIADRVREDHDRDIAGLKADDFGESPFDRQEALETIGQLRQKIASMGEINPAAVEEFEELNERHDFLSGQKEDLEASIATLEKAIRKINRTSRDKFLTTFREVSGNFSRLFPRLFEGGSAEMTLMDENDPLNTGVEIQVKPPGKKLRSMQLLSGGEKALVSLTMILSMFLAKPSPFCILDEVDAPLDDDNLSHFARIVKELSKRYQFLVITHNKLTMESADVLYGITMREPGVSQVVSVKLKDVV